MGAFEIKEQREGNGPTRRVVDVQVSQSAQTSTGSTPECLPSPVNVFLKAPDNND